MSNIFDDLQNKISDLRGIGIGARRAAGAGTFGTAMVAMGGASGLETSVLGLTERGLQRAAGDMVEDGKKNKDNDLSFG